jgi:uncharacterized RDD family membrane protein YckC
MCIAYEGVLLFGVLFFFGYAFSALAQFKGEPGPMLWAFRIFVLLVLGVYFVWSWSDGRRTLPMKTMGVRLTDARGEPPSVARTLCRFVAAVAMLIGAIAAAVYLHPALAILLLAPATWSLIDRDHRTLYDIACGTRLVYDAGSLRAVRKGPPAAGAT